MGVDDLFALKFTASPPLSTQIHSILSIQSMGVHDLFAFVSTPRHQPILFVTHIYVMNMKRVISNQ